MTRFDGPKIDEQIEAWDKYCAARSRADETQGLSDGIAAVQAWKIFANLFLADDRKLPLAPHRSNVAIFPVHRTRPSARQPDGAA
jgi:hypothetical protein